MAGGIGSRFWPVSRASHPKQFIDILGTGESLIQQTFNRVRNLCPPQNIYVVTNREYKALTLQQLPELSEEQVISEPLRRNTAPCIAYANFKILTVNPEANIIVTPADHLILKEETYRQVLTKALVYAGEEDTLVTIGIHPNRPDTGYGYIEYDANGNSDFRKVVKFTEKPDLETARKFLNSGNYSWNSGMFIWKLSSIQKAMKTHLPEVYNIFEAGMKKYNTPEETAFITEVYNQCPDISIDYGVMEKAGNVQVINADFGWSDLGTWGSLYTHLQPDEDGNAVISGDIMLYESNDNIINMPAGKLTVIQGLDDYIVVDTNDALLICKKEEEQKIKQFVSDIKEKKGMQYL